MTHTNPTTRNSHSPARRAGFTLIELMVVVVIIGILAALLFPAINGAIERARTAEVTSEMHLMESAVTQFQNRFGVQPPSGLVFYENGSGDPSWAADTTSPAPNQSARDLRRTTSHAIIHQIWPDYNFLGSIDLNADGDMNDVLFLNGAECLTFFLGGTQRIDTNGDGTIDQTDGWGAEGFAANPISPLLPTTTAANRIGPFHKKFDTARFVDRDMDGMPEYLDALNGQQTPMLYFSSYAGRGYKPYGIDGMPGTEDDEILPLSYGRGPFAVYYKNDLNKSDPMTYPDGQPWNPDSFQLISPGRDGEYGHGGEFNADFTLTPAVSPQGKRPITDERDNITNFRNERLNP